MRSSPFPDLCAFGVAQLLSVRTLGFLLRRASRSVFTVRASDAERRVVMLLQQQKVAIRTNG
jgi:hypothetical protein